VVCRPMEDERMPCERPVLLMLLSDGSLLAYIAFASPVGLRFARLSIDWTGHSDGRGPRGRSSRMTRFDGLGAGGHTYRCLFAALPSPFPLPSSPPLTFSPSIVFPPLRSGGGYQALCWRGVQTLSFMVLY